MNIHGAKTHLSRLLAQVEQGESVVIARAGKPIARLVPIDAPVGTPSPIGFLKGRITMPDDFDRMETDTIDALFSGS